MPCKRERSTERKSAKRKVLDIRKNVATSALARCKYGGSVFGTKFPVTDKAEALFLVHRIPYPPDKGDKIRSWRMFRHLADRYNLHLVAFADDPEDMVHQAHLERYAKSVSIFPLDPFNAKLKSLTALASGKPLSLMYFQDQKVQSKVNELRERPLAAEFVFSSSMAPYIEDQVQARPRLIDFCDADSVKWSQYAEKASGPMRWVYQREGKKLAQAEAAMINWADASFAVTPQEAALLNALPGVSKSVDWWGNGVDFDYFTPSKDYVLTQTPADVVFVGAMDYRANVDAVDRFVKEIWPQIRKARQEASFAIVGRNPTASVTALGQTPGVQITGAVDDVRPWLDAAKIVVAPLCVGRGIQNKVLEAMAMGKALVASPEAMIGVQCSDDAVAIEDGTRAFADRVIALLSDHEHREKMGARARKDIEENYNWTTQLKRLDTAVSTLVVR